MKFRRIVLLIWVFLLSWCVLEILFRRFVWAQVPTQIDSWLVYALLLVNSLVVWRCLRQVVRPVVQTKTDKN